MATQYWLGGDGDWGNAANWDSIVPVANDVAIFPEGVSVGVSAGLDQGGIDLDAILIDAGFTGDIGSTGSPLLIAADLIEHNGPGGLFVESDLNATTLKIDEIRIKCSNPNAIVEIGSNAADAGDIVKVIAVRGNVTIKANAKLDAAMRLECGHRGGANGDLTLTLLDFTAAGTEDLADLRMWSGNVTIHRQCATAIMSAGNLIIDTQPVAIVEQSGGTFMYDYRAVGGDATIIRGYGGVLDLMHTADEKTITRVESHEGSTIRMNPEFHTITTHVDFRLNQ